MTHAWHDTYHHATTPAHHFDPRAKLAVGLLYTGAVLLTPHVSWGKGAAFSAFLILTAVLCHVPFGRMLGRIGTLAPFLLLMGLSAWLSSISAVRALQIFVKAILSIGAMTVLAASVPFRHAPRASRDAHAPDIH